MTIAFVAALALAAQTTPATAAAPVEPNLDFATPIAGQWTYSATARGSEATFANAARLPQVTVRCTRATRKVQILKAASAASPTLSVWTSAQARSLPATFGAASARVIAELGAYDELLDAIASSRGRIAFGTPGVAALVVPPWAEVARVIEDCRA
jgi:hypothetical protein